MKKMFTVAALLAATSVPVLAQQDAWNGLTANQRMSSGLKIINERCGTKLRMSDFDGQQKAFVRSKIMEIQREFVLQNIAKICAVVK